MGILDGELGFSANVSMGPRPRPTVVPNPSKANQSGASSRPSALVANPIQDVGTVYKVGIAGKRHRRDGTRRLARLATGIVGTRFGGRFVEVEVVGSALGSADAGEEVSSADRVMEGGGHDCDYERMCRNALWERIEVDEDLELKFLQRTSACCSRVLTMPSFLPIVFWPPRLEGVGRRFPQRMRRCIEAPTFQKLEQMAC